MGSVEQFLEHRAERLGAAWRRIHTSQQGAVTPDPPMLDGVIEPFLRALAASLRGADGSAWSRTRGVLRLSPVRGEMRLDREFEALGLCLATTLASLGASGPERALIREQLRDARLSARALLRGLQGASARPRVPFGGLVLERFEAAPGQPPPSLPPVH